MKIHETEEERKEREKKELEESEKLAEEINDENEENNNSENTDDSATNKVNIENPSDFEEAVKQRNKDADTLSEINKEVLEELEKSENESTSNFMKYGIAFGALISFSIIAYLVNKNKKVEVVEKEPVNDVQESKSANSSIFGG